MSAHAAVEPMTEARVERLPSASKASTSNVYAVPQVRPETVAARLQGRRAVSTVDVRSVALHRDVVGRGAPRERDARPCRTRDREARRHRGRSRIRGRRRRGAGGRGGGELRLRRGVAGGVEGDDGKSVGGPAREPGLARGRRAYRRDLGAVSVDVVARDADVVGRAFQPRVRPVCVTLEAASPVGAEGGVVSDGGDGDGAGAVEQAVVEVVSCACDEELPAASRATTAKA